MTSSPPLVDLVIVTFIGLVVGAVFLIHQRTIGVPPLQSWPATKAGPLAGCGKPAWQIEARISRVGACDPDTPTQLATTGFGSLLPPLPVNVPHLVCPPLTDTESIRVDPLKVTFNVWAASLLLVTLYRMNAPLPLQSAPARNTGDTTSEGGAVVVMVVVVVGGCVVVVVVVEVVDPGGRVVVLPGAPVVVVVVVEGGAVVEPPGIEVVVSPGTVVVVSPC